VSKKAPFLWATVQLGFQNVTNKTVLFLFSRLAIFWDLQVKAPINSKALGDGTHPVTFVKWIWYMLQL
jgi:hypothetical protein